MDIIINKFFTERYKYLLECSNNILKLIKRQDLKYELVNDCFIYIQANQTKLQIQIEAGNIEAVAVRWMTMQVKWSDTQFKKAWVYPNKYITPHSFEDVESYCIIDDNISEEEHLQQEKEIQDKLNHIAVTISNESLDKKLLFNDVFNKGINTSGKLAKHTGLSRTGCYYLIRDLKNNLKNNYKDKLI